MATTVERPPQREFVQKMKVGEVKEWTWAQSYTGAFSAQKSLGRAARELGWTVTTRLVKTDKKRTPYIVRVKLLAKRDLRNF